MRPDLPGTRKDEEKGGSGLGDGRGFDPPEGFKSQPLNERL